MLQVLKESAFLFLAFLVGLYTFHKLNLFYRLMFLQVTLAAIVYIASYAITIYQEDCGLTPNNQWVYNIYIVGEVILLSYGGIVYFRDKTINILIWSGLAFFLIVFSYHLIIHGIKLFANTALIGGGIFIVVTYLLVLYNALNTSVSPFTAKPEVFLCAGIVVYFACNVPFMGFIHYLYQRYPKQAEQMFYFITEFLGNVRYLLVAISFWLFTRRQAFLINKI